MRLICTWLLSWSSPDWLCWTYMIFFWLSVSVKTIACQGSAPQRSLGTSMEVPFLIDGLGLDSDLFDSPIHCLPQELLSNIFLLYDRTSDTSPTSFAWTVAHVCSRWRQTAFNTPRLWSTIILDVSSLHVIKHQLDSRLQFLDTCLALSKAVPIDFIVCLPFPWLQQTVVPEAVLGRLCLHTWRWRQAFFFSSMDVLTPWAHVIRCNTPILQSIGFSSFNGDAGSARLLQYIFAESGVSRLALTSCSPEAVVEMTMPWRQISSLKLICCRLDTLPAVLDQFPNLVELEFEGELSVTRTLYSERMIELPNLLTLRVSGYLHQITSLSHSIQAPSLVDLSFTLFRASHKTLIDNAAGVIAVRQFISKAKKVERLRVKYMDHDIMDTVWDYAIRYTL